MSCHHWVDVSKADRHDSFVFFILDIINYHSLHYLECLSVSQLGRKLKQSLCITEMKNERLNFTFYLFFWREYLECKERLSIIQTTDGEILTWIINMTINNVLLQRAHYKQKNYPFTQLSMLLITYFHSFLIVLLSLYKEKHVYGIKLILKLQIIKFSVDMFYINWSQLYSVCRSAKSFLIWLRKDSK